MERPRRVGMAWYRPEDYTRLRELMQDADRLPDSYDAWRISAEQVEREVTRSGMAVIRVLITPEEFVAWCKERGVQADATARSRFASESVARSDAAGWEVARSQVPET
ncbi:hypothetical protein [Methylobacterium oryzisoli]|uniref:hypothetical protein n=1 Tax=Methylobacterium oryzisoli TaxID=3385502 RepID=UPI00389188A1